MPHDALKLVTKRDVIKKVAARWHEAYFDEKGRGDYYGEDKPEIYAELLGLHLDTCTEDEVTAIIGNDSWTELRCDVCNERQEQVSVVGCEDTRICAGCTLKAVKLFLAHVVEPS